MFKDFTRRDFLKFSAGTVAAPFINCNQVRVSKLMTRTLGRTGFDVTTIGLGGQASIQWTPADVDPVAIIIKAVKLGVNYLDTSNVYGPSQENFGKAFKAIDLIPGLPGYDERLRKSLFLASKTMIRYSKGTDLGRRRGRSEGPAESLAVEDLKRSLSTIYGDGRGGYPAGAYLDLFQIHNLNTMEEVDAIYTGYDQVDPGSDEIGTLAALVDYRDGSNLTGLNPKEEKLIRHIGITGHHSSPVMMECLQRDSKEIIDTMLIAINANDRHYLNHQYNAIPVAQARNLGLIAMKVFADGAMYTKEPRWSRTPEDVVRLVGTEDLPSRPLIEYSLTTPGITTAIIGIGQINPDPMLCQLEQNLSAAQIEAESYSPVDREEIEHLALRAREGQTNWFQVEKRPLEAPRNIKAEIDKQDDRILVRLSWHSAYAADSPLQHYEILLNDQQIGKVDHTPQTTKTPFIFEATVEEVTGTCQVVAVDSAGQKAAGDLLELG